MQTPNKAAITVQATVNAPIEKVWESWTEPTHIMNWCSASPDWHAPHADNDLRVDGKFTTRMEAKDGSMGFDFGGVYTKVEKHAAIEYAMSDGRTVSVTFTGDGNQTKVVETFDPEDTNPLEMQKMGWQSILDNFKKYTEDI